MNLGSWSTGQRVARRIFELGLPAAVSNSRVDNDSNVLAISSLPDASAFLEFFSNSLRSSSERLIGARTSACRSRCLRCPRNFQGIVFDVFTGPTENRVQQFFFGRQFGLAFRADLADQNVAWFDVRSRPVRFRFSSRLRSAFSETLGMSRVNSSRPSLVSRISTSKVFDVDRRVRVVANQFFADDDRVFVVEPVERHETDQDVSAQRQFTVSGRGTIGNDLASFRPCRPHDDHGFLVQAGAFVEPLVFFQFVVIAEPISIRSNRHT